MEKDEGAHRPRFEEMAYGPIGAAVKNAMPHTEADPIGVLASVYALYSAALAGAVVQPNGRPAVVWTVLAGRSKIGRKGYALSTAERVLGDSIGDFLRARKRQGISSGPALVNVMWEAHTDSLTTEEGEDGRVIILEEEWQSTLKRTNRCPTYSSVLRSAWDGKRISNTTKGKKGERDEQSVDSPLLGFHAHIQPGTWSKHISMADALGGSYNRLLPVMVERSKLLPTSDENPLDAIRPTAALRLAYEWAKKEPRRMTMVEAARIRYDELREHYEDSLSEMPEELSCFVERADEQVMRIATVLTAAQRKEVIQLGAIEAARAFVDYSISSVRQLVSQSAGRAVRPTTPLDQRITKLLAERGPLTRSELYRALGRYSAAQVEHELNVMPNVQSRQIPSRRPGAKPTVYSLVEEPEPETQPTPPAAAKAPPRQRQRKAASTTSKAPAKKTKKATTPAKKAAVVEEEETLWA